ncbi:MAG: hypothetical protein R3Y38_08055 [Rikenellaceae bacterium]
MKKITSMILEKIKAIPGLNLLNPVMNFLNNGDVFKQPISFIYLLFALASALSPFYLLYEIIDSGFFRHANAAAFFGFFFIFIVLLITAIFSFRYWLERSSNIQDISDSKSEYVGTPVLTSLIQHIGEWAGVTLATAGTLIVIIGTFTAPEILYYLDLPSGALVGAILSCIITGFVIILVTRVLAELIRALTSIANNTQK